MTPRQDRDQLAAEITRQASKQTYYIFRFFADRDRVFQAYRSYAYFRWVDDLLDNPDGEPVLNGEKEYQLDLSNQDHKLEFVNRQRKLLEGFYNDEFPGDVTPVEKLLMDLVESDPDKKSGLYLYLDNMMKVMEFDAERKGREITEAEMEEYTTSLTVAVTELLHYFIGHDQPQPRHEDRYQSVEAAHITHMLRDALADAEDGYVNIPHEYLDEHHITPLDVQSDAYRNWVCSRTQLAFRLFESGQSYISRGENLRRRLAGVFYTARFMWVLDTIKKENFCLRKDYADRKSLPAALWIISYVLKTLWGFPLQEQKYIPLTGQLDGDGKP